nr:uncharacterized protein LOC128703259 [Cherax quadricarinatus]
MENHTLSGTITTVITVWEHQSLITVITVWEHQSLITVITVIMIPSKYSLMLIFFLGVRLSVEVCAPDCSVVDPGISVRDPTDCTRYYVCLSIHGNKQNYQYTAQPNPLSCSKYDVCLAETGLFLEFDCPSDAPYFDFRKSKCQTDSTLCYDYCDMCLPHCTYDGQLLIDPTDCHQFYLCTPPTIALFLCPNSLIFNRSTGECEANAECEILCETERQ